MSIQSLNKAIEAKGLSSTEKLTLIVLANYASDKGITFLSKDRVANITGQTNRTIRRHYAKFKELGWLTETGEHVGTTNQIPVFRLEIKADTSDRVSDKGGHLEHERRTPVTGKADTSVPHNHNNHKIEPSDYMSSPKGDKPPTIPEIVNLYHKKLPQLPKVEKITKTRKGLIQQRIREDLPILSHWENYFEWVSKSPFLMGKAEPTNGRPPFRADLEWLCRPSNFTKVSEEKYHG